MLNGSIFQKGQKGSVFFAWWRSFSCFLVWRRIFWSTELIAGLKPQGDSFVCKYWGWAILLSTDPGQPCSVIITILKTGALLCTTVASLYSYFCCFHLEPKPSPLRKLFLVPCQPLQKLSSNGLWQGGMVGDPRTAGVPLVADIPSPLSAPE